jgi:hypothetical protein
MMPENSPQNALQAGVEDTAFSQLMTADQGTLLDLIDNLRTLGINKDVPLPQM